MKASYLGLIAFAALVYFIMRDEKVTSTANEEKDTACLVAITSMRESLFPKNKLIEAEAWIIEIANLMGVKTPEASNVVANYEVGRATSAQLALNTMANSPACKPREDDTPSLHKPAEHHWGYSTEKSDDSRRKSDDDDDD
jgi:hypothetical protein